MQILSRRDPARGRIRTVTNRDRARSTRAQAMGRSPLTLLTRRFDPRFAPSPSSALLGPPRPSSALRVILYCRRPVGSYVAIALSLELLTLNPLLHIARVEFNLVARMPSRIVFLRGIQYRPLMAATSERPR
jgi:hypothetical protein